MPHVDLTPSESNYIRLALTVKQEKLRQARRWAAQGERVVSEAVDSILARAGVGEIETTAQVICGTDGAPARIVWAATAQPTNGNGQHLGQTSRLEGLE